MTHELLDTLSLLFLIKNYASRVTDEFMFDVGRITFSGYESWVTILAVLLLSIVVRWCLVALVRVFFCFANSNSSLQILLLAAVLLFSVLLLEYQALWLVSALLFCDVWVRMLATTLMFRKTFRIPSPDPYCSVAFVTVDLYLFLERPFSYSLTCSVELKHAESKLSHVCRSERIPERRPEMKDVSQPAPQVCHPHSVTTLLQPHSLLARRHDARPRGRGCCKRQTTVETHLQSRKEDTQKHPELCKPAKQNMWTNPSCAIPKRKRSTVHVCMQTRRQSHRWGSPAPTWRWKPSLRVGDIGLGTLHELGCPDVGVVALALQCPKVDAPPPGWWLHHATGVLRSRRVRIARHDMWIRLERKNNLKKNSKNAHTCECTNNMRANICELCTEQSARHYTDTLREMGGSNTHCKSHKTPTDTGGIKPSATRCCWSWRIFSSRNSKVRTRNNSSHVSGDNQMLSDQNSWRHQRTDSMWECWFRTLVGGSFGRRASAWRRANLWDHKLKWRKACTALVMWTIFDGLHPLLRAASRGFLLTMGGREREVEGVLLRALWRPISVAPCRRAQKPSAKTCTDHCLLGSTSRRNDSSPCKCRQVGGRWKPCTSHATFDQNSASSPRVQDEPTEMKLCADPWTQHRWNCAPTI